MRSLIQFLTFQTMAAPILLQLLFWGGVGGVLYGAWVLIQLEHWAWWTPLLFGLPMVRVIFEISILAFRSYDRLGEIREELRRLNESRS